jgi:outer membrane lipoprotein-sorting protein
MRSSVSRVAAAVIFILALTGVALWFHGAGATPTLADFIQPVLDAKTAKMKAFWERDGKRVATADIFISGSRVRMEQQHPGRSNTIHVQDKSKGVSIMLNSATKTAVVNKLVGVPRERASVSPLDQLRSMVLDENKPNVKRESLGEKEIDGRRAVGWRLSGPGLHEPGLTVTIWGDPESGLPIRMESFYAMSGKAATMREFILNPDLDESLFNLDPPAGYKVINTQTDLSPRTEKDLGETLRRFGEVCGVFPNALDVLNVKTIIEEFLRRAPDKDDHKANELLMLALRGFGFVVELPSEADAHYAGKGVSFGAADMPIFWYRPTGVKTYRVIYADLSIRETDAPPTVPDAQPVPGQPGGK